MQSNLFFQRIVRSGMHHVWRNSTVTFSSILVMTITLLIIALLVFSNAILSYSIERISQKVDVNIYFLPNAPEEVITEVRTTLEDLPEVASVEYVTRDEALTLFQERHQDDRLTMQALEELGGNPFGASLNVRAHDPSQYSAVAKFLEPDGGLSGNAQSMIEKVNFYQNQLVISRISHLMTTIQHLGLIFSIVFIALSVIITVNTVRLAIYSAREEISVMQMIGADSSFVQGPFFVAGIFYGLIASVISIIILYPVTSWIARQTTSFFGGLSVFDYYISNFIWLILIILAVGIIMGIISSALAVRSYMKS